MSLSSDSIQDTINKLNNLKKDLSSLDQIIPKELATETKEQISHFYSVKGFSSDETPKIDVEQTQKGWRAYIEGSEVIYEEFGTGDVGAKHGHPWKGFFDLNPYNSGATIRPTSKLSFTLVKNLGLKPGKYWTYSDTEGVVYTQGIPAGKFMYNSDMWLRKNYKKIVKKKVDDVISKV